MPLGLRLALLLQLAVVVEPLTPPPPRCARFSIRAAGQAFLAPTLAVTLAFSDGTAALAEQPLQEQPSGAAVARMISADDITSSELVSALGRGAAEAAEAARLAGGALESVGVRTECTFVKDALVGDPDEGFVMRLTFLENVEDEYPFED